MIYKHRKRSKYTNVDYWWAMEMLEDDSKKEMFRYYLKLRQWVSDWGTCGAFFIDKKLCDYLHLRKSTAEVTIEKLLQQGWVVRDDRNTELFRIVSQSKIACSRMTTTKQERRLMMLMPAKLIRNSTWRNRSIVYHFIRECNIERNLEFQLKRKNKKYITKKIRGKKTLDVTLRDTSKDVIHGTLECLPLHYVSCKMIAKSAGISLSTAHRLMRAMTKAKISNYHCLPELILDRPDLLLDEQARAFENLRRSQLKDLSQHGFYLAHKGQLWFYPISIRSESTILMKHSCFKIRKGNRKKAKKHNGAGSVSHETSLRDTLREEIPTYLL